MNIMRDRLDVTDSNQALVGLLLDAYPWWDCGEAEDVGTSIDMNHVSIFLTRDSTTHDIFLSMNARWFGSIAGCLENHEHALILGRVISGWVEE